jgi:hypothetical protein
MAQQSLPVYFMGYRSFVPGVGIFPYGNGTGFVFSLLRLSLDKLGFAQDRKYTQPFRFPTRKARRRFAPGTLSVFHFNFLCAVWDNVGTFLTISNGTNI